MSLQDRISDIFISGGREWTSDLHFQRTLAFNLGLEIEYLRMSNSEDGMTEGIRMDIVRQYVKADLYYQTLNVKTVEEEPVYTVM